MRPIKFGLAAALMIALMAPAGASIAAKKDAVDAKARAQGMAEAPAAAKAAGVTCEIADARFIGKTEEKKVTNSFYEIDCASGPGFVIQASAGTSAAFPCIQMNAANNTKNGLSCILPGNANLAGDLAPLVAKAGVQCTPEKARMIGTNTTSAFFEVLCPGNNGYLLITSAVPDLNKKPTIQNCLMTDDTDSNLKCTLSDKATRLAVVDRYAAEAKNGCQVKDRRYIGVSTSGGTFYEASCQDGKGYIYKIDDNNALAVTYECAKAQGILGGCTLTDAREAATEQAALYTKLAKAAGSNCEVSKYAFFPTTETNKDVVELVCADGSGGVGVFVSGGKSTVYDCGRALVAGYRCSLNKMETGYAALTSDLLKFGKDACKVSASRLAELTDKGTTMLEVGCADGLKGYMIEYSTSPTVNAVGAIGCSFARCKLPNNS